MQMAIKSALDACHSLYKEVGLSNFMLEEVEASEDGRLWHVTIGFDKMRPVRSEILAALGNRELVRVYKTFKVDANTGTFKGMKIWHGDAE